MTDPAPDAWWPRIQLFDGLSEWTPYRFAGRPYREWHQRELVCHACGATTHQPARRGWSWRIVRARGQSGRYTQSRCAGCALNRRTS